MSFGDYGLRTKAVAALSICKNRLNCQSNTVRTERQTQRIRRVKDTKRQIHKDTDNRYNTLKEDTVKQKIYHQYTYSQAKPNHCTSEHTHTHTHVRTHTHSHTHRNE